MSSFLRRRTGTVRLFQHLKFHMHHFNVVLTSAKLDMLLECSLTFSMRSNCSTCFVCFNFGHSTCAPFREQPTDHHTKTVSQEREREREERYLKRLIEKISQQGVVENDFFWALQSLSTVTWIFDGRVTKRNCSLLFPNICQRFVLKMC